MLQVNADKVDPRSHKDFRDRGMTDRGNRRQFFAATAAALAATAASLAGGRQFYRLEPRGPYGISPVAVCIRELRRGDRFVIRESGRYLVSGSITITADNFGGDAIGYEPDNA